MNIAKLREMKVLKEPPRVSFISRGTEMTNFEFLAASRRLVTVLKISVSGEASG